jgi:hypothetical protein
MINCSDARGRQIIWGGTEIFYAESRGGERTGDLVGDEHG